MVIVRPEDRKAALLLVSVTAAMYTGALIALGVFDSKAAFWAIMGLGLLVVLFLRFTVFRDAKPPS